MPEVFVKSFTHLKDRPKADEALKILQRVASLVKPIMRKRGGSFPFLQSSSRATPVFSVRMNVNAGQKVLCVSGLRTRQIRFTRRSIIGTMLHELHITCTGRTTRVLQVPRQSRGRVRVPPALRLRRRRLPLEGKRLGTSVSHNLPPHIARQKAAAAAEKRRQVSAVLGGGGRLGLGAGAVGSRTPKSPRELAAEAAERRARDEKACASGEVALVEAAKAAKESVQDDVIDLTADSDSEGEVIIIDEDEHVVMSPLPLTSPASDGAPPAASKGGSHRSSSSSSLSALSSGSASSSSSQSLSDFTTALRPGNMLSPTSASSFSPSSSGTSTPATRPARPTVRRVPHGAGSSTPTLPKPRSVSRPPTMLAKRPTTPPPTRAGSVRGGVGVPSPLSIVPQEESAWACARCTLVNDALALQCTACLGARPSLAGAVEEAAAGRASKRHRAPEAVRKEGVDAS
ncbi:WLM-domain-containing protein [Epithele typhae]|uniref:WLM-domain-containing protein n=1 Tax=Epithele typhae TaxID=378194 RepID=UPI0020087D8C|nr:WLM-domain-containing protein [Epithele typhae]KAH9931997.1 WLM-domain-containing protein [Epithele typhae]